MMTELAPVYDWYSCICDVVHTTLWSSTQIHDVVHTKLWQYTHIHDAVHVFKVSYTWPTSHDQYITDATILSLESITGTGTMDQSAW